MAGGLLDLHQYRFAEFRFLVLRPLPGATHAVLRLARWTAHGRFGELKGRGMNKGDDTGAAARKHLVERRRALIKSLSFAQQDEQLEAHMDLIVRIQAVIDVIDRVLREEAVTP
jgi:hypothetical protein